MPAISVSPPLQATVNNYRPYLTPAGPEALQTRATPAVVEVGTPFELTATLNDTRFNNQNGSEPVQAIVAAEYYLDLPPWEAGSPAPTGCS